MKDKSSLRIVDEYNDEVLNVRYVNPHAIWFNALLRYPGSNPVSLKGSTGGGICTAHGSTAEINIKTKPEPSPSEKALLPGVILPQPTPQLLPLALVNCQPIGTQDSVSVNSTEQNGPTVTSFYTEGKEQTVQFLKRPERVYVEPPGKTVASSDLPTQITLGKYGDKDYRITIKEFTDRGVVTDTSAAIVLTEKRETCGVQVKMTMLDAAVEPPVSAGPSPATPQPQKLESQESKGPVVSAPNGIAIGGGNVTNPTVNNFGPIPPIPTFELLDKQPLPELAAPQQWIRIAINRTFLDPKFAVLCDRPCKVLRADLIFGPNGGFKQVSWGTIPDHENIAAISINQPNPMPSDDTVEAVIASKDDKPVKIIGVRVLVITPPKQ